MSRHLIVSRYWPVSYLHKVFITVFVTAIIQCRHWFCFRYKILFLDVLFPLHVKKIIFVDADLVRISLSTFSFLPNCMEYYSLHAIRWSFFPFFLYRPPAVTPLERQKQNKKKAWSQVRTIALVSFKQEGESEMCRYSIFELGFSSLSS